MIGIDIVHIPRIQKAVQNDAFKTRVFTAQEIAYCDGNAKPHIHYAGVFAAKEGAVKALKCGFSGGIGPLDIEIVHETDGAPQINFYGKAQELLNDRKADVSISHDGEYAIAVVEIL
ncbi:MAG: holo-ACP synthase [Clostridiales bacterium]|nr:holo-ACP synthase [Clostridiales bacterium]